MTPIMKCKLVQHMLEECISHSFSWNKKPLHKTLGPESNLKRMGGGGGGRTDITQNRKSFIIFIIFSKQTMCPRVFDGPDFFACQSLISRRYDESKIQKVPHFTKNFRPVHCMFLYLNRKCATQTVNLSPEHR